MTGKIGFCADTTGGKDEKSLTESSRKRTMPKKSVVQVYFPQRGMTLAYYNDQFDLNPGDLVYVDGKLEGLHGYVESVNYSFHIRISDYKRVVAVADTTVSGQFFMVGTQFITFDPAALPPEKVRSWFLAPENEEEYVSGSDDTPIMLDELKQAVSSVIVERGENYAQEGRVLYLSVVGTSGYAIVQGERVYEGSFTYKDGQVSQLTCSCFYGGLCKHSVATMIQLRETLSALEARFEQQYAQTGCFAAVQREILFRYVMERGENGYLTLGIAE